VERSGGGGAQAAGSRLTSLHIQVLSIRFN
jgi:hypothetical protein